MNDVGGHLPLDVEALWDFSDPAESERRFREAMSTATGDDALILQTQIARTLSLRERFEEAHDVLDGLQVPSASVEPQVRLLLERGRTLRSSGKPVEAEAPFRSAFELAESANLEFLAGDALHMIAVVQETPDTQIEWHRRTVDYAHGSVDVKAKAWEASALNNLGVTLSEVGRHDEALVAFRDGLAAYERAGRVDDIPVARWMVANMLRRLGRLDEAVAIQRALEEEFDAAGQTDPYVYEELAELFTALGDRTKATHYRALHRQASETGVGPR